MKDKGWGITAFSPAEVFESDLCILTLKTWEIFTLNLLKDRIAGPISPP
jgi:hypothetical protein